MYLLNRRFQQHQQIIWQGCGGVQDRTIYEDSVFAKVSSFGLGKFCCEDKSRKSCICTGIERF